MRAERSPRRVRGPQGFSRGRGVQAGGGGRFAADAPGAEVRRAIFLDRARKCWSVCAGRKFARGTPMKTVSEQVCGGCGERLPASSFYKHSGRWSGLQSRCIECSKGQRKASRQKTVRDK